VVCSFTADGGTRAMGRSGVADGTVTVAIPRVVFVRTAGRRLVVTTNTGAPPQHLDAFYSIASGTARPAGAGLRNEVLSWCGHDRGVR